MALNLPTRLRREPLVEAVCELRFSASQEAASELLTGSIYPKLKVGLVKADRLPIANVPPQFRASDPKLKYAPVTRLRGERFVVNIGERVVGLSSIRPYCGWQEFRQKILEVVELVDSSGVVSATERFSLKYVDLLAEPIPSSLSALSLTLAIGEHKIAAEPLQLRIEVERYGYMHIVQVSLPVSMKSPHGEQHAGLAVDVDTLWPTIGTESFAEALSARLDEAHAANKKVFFDLLSPETLELLEPEYEPK